MNDFLDAASVLRVVRSMALACSRDSVIRNEPLPPPAMPPALRGKLVRNAALFFGLGDREAALLECSPEYARWTEIIRASAAAAGGRTLTFLTSGSTGQPCPRTHSLAELEEEASALRPFFADRKRVVSVMPVHHIFGFAFALMLPKLLGIPVRDKPALPSAGFFSELRDGDLVPAFPVFWKSFLEMCSGRFAVPCPPGVHGVTSAAPCPPEIVEGLTGLTEGRERPILSAMTEIYGATEFGAVGIRRECREPYVLLPHLRRAAPLSRENGREEWALRRGNGPATPLPDTVAWRDERRFVPLRRKDRAVQIGGINVFPERVAELLRGHPKVADCVVRLMRPEEGTRLKAFVVPREAASGPALRRELKQWLAARLEPASMPRSVSFGPGLPLTRTGKPADWSIAGRKA